MSKTKECELCQAPMIPDPSPDMRGAMICSDCDFKPDKIKNIFKKRMERLRNYSEAMGEAFPTPPNFDIPGFKKPLSILEPKSEMNPYLADVFALVDEDEFAIRDQMIMASSKFMMPLAMGRYRYVYKYAWAIPCKAALEAIASYSPIVEIGAGNGYWASLLHSMGAANGAAVIQTLQGEIMGIVPYKPQTGKDARLAAVSPIYEAGNVYYPDPTIAPWVGTNVEEVVSFPNAAHDDTVDCASLAIMRLRETSSKRLEMLLKM